MTRDVAALAIPRDGIPETHCVLYRNLVYLNPTMSLTGSAIDDYLPLAPAVLHILLALAGEDLHGYGIMQEVSRQSGGRVKLGPGTLYDNLQRLVKKGIIEPTGEETDSRRLYYHLTTLGGRVIAAEISRLEAVVREGRLRIPASRLRRI